LQSLLVDLAAFLFVHGRSRSELVDPRLKQLPRRVEQVQGDELAAVACVDGGGGLERVGQEKLPAIGRVAYVLGVIVVVVDRDEIRRTSDHG
jgi:hypothetical protein